MCKPKSSKSRIPASVCISVLIGLSALLLPRASIAAVGNCNVTCGPGGCQVPAGIDGSICPDFAHIGDVVKVQTVTVSVNKTPSCQCPITNIVSYLSLPNEWDITVPLASRQRQVISSGNDV